MFRRTRTVPLYAVVLAALVLAATATPAAARHRKGGTKPWGEVASFDGSLLTVTSRAGKTYLVPVDDDAKIKIEHRGHKANGKKKKPSNGSFEDLVPGARILFIKVRCSELVKLRLRPPSTDPAATTASSGAVSVRNDGAGDKCRDDDDADDGDDVDDDDDADTSGGTGGGGSSDDGSNDDDSQDGTDDEGDDDDDGLLDDLVPGF